MIVQVPLPDTNINEKDATVQNKRKNTTPGSLERAQCWAPIERRMWMLVRLGVHDERLGLIEMEFRLEGLGLTGYSIRWGLIRIRDLDGF